MDNKNVKTSGEIV